METQPTKLSYLVLVLKKFVQRRHNQPNYPIMFLWKCANWVVSSLNFKKWRPNQPNHPNCLVKSNKDATSKHLVDFFSRPSMVHRWVTSATLWSSKSSIIWEVRGWVFSTLAHDGEEDRATMREPRALKMDDLLSYVPKEVCGSGRDHGQERRSYSSCSKSSPWESLYQGLY